MICVFQNGERRERRDGRVLMCDGEQKGPPEVRKDTKKKSCIQKLRMMKEEKRQL